MRTIYALPEIESAPYEQVRPNMADSGGKCALCKGSYRTIGEFKSHRCVVADALRSVTKRGSVAQYRGAEIDTPEPRTEAGSETVFRNAPGRKKVHSSNAAKQRAYRDRKRRP